LHVLIENIKKNDGKTGHMIVCR